MTGIEHTRSRSQPRERVFLVFDKVKWFALTKGTLSRPLPRPTYPGGHWSLHKFGNRKHRFGWMKITPLLSPLPLGDRAAFKSRFSSELQYASPLPRSGGGRRLSGGRGSFRASQWTCWQTALPYPGPEARPCMFNSSHTASLHIMADCWLVESRGIITPTCGLTTWERFVPPAFGVRNWYIMRHDRLSQG